MGDRIQIQQVVLNLLMNAFDAVQPFEPAHRLVFLRTCCRDSTAVVEVSDRGAGLSDTDLSRIFEPFYTTKRDGIGLGLSICQAIVAAHGGTLDTTRNPVTGMTFSACFPVRRSLADKSRSPATHRLQERR
jgi:two-component system, LuxR family, sensor kinase FixL